MVSDRFLIVATLLEAGRSAATPVAVIERGTTAQQRRLVTTLSELVADVRDAGIAPPAMVVIGEVVSLAGSLDWYHSDNDNLPAEQVQAQ